MYALARNDAIEYIGDLPSRWNDGKIVWDLTDPTVDKQSLGWYQVVETVKPTDTENVVHVSCIRLVEGIPTRVWAPKTLSSNEATEEKARKIEAQLRANSQAQIDVLLESISTLTKLLAKTNSDINANPAAAIKEVTRELMTVTRRTLRLARLSLNVFDSANVGE